MNTGGVPAQQSRIAVQARLADDDPGNPNEGVLALFPGEDYISAWSGVSNDGIHKLTKAELLQRAIRLGLQKPEELLK